MADLTHSRNLRHAALAMPRPRRLSIWSYLALMRQRRALANLDETRLNDLGLTKKQAETEANRPIWDVPSHWSK